jgi:DNA polymerase-3 subunit chi
VTEVVFHVRVADPVVYGCRLLRKALARYPRITVTTAQGAGARLDEALWTFSPRDFLPHVFASAPDAVRQVSPILLVEADGAQNAALPPAPLLVNFGGEPGAAAAGAFERMIEVVGDGPQEAAAARRRWKDYVAAGMAVSHHDLSDWSANR